MREAIGPADELVCDVNQVLSVDEAIRFCRDVEPSKLAWFISWVRCPPGPTLRGEMPALLKAQSSRP